MPDVIVTSQQKGYCILHLSVCDCMTNTTVESCMESPSIDVCVEAFGSDLINFGASCGRCGNKMVFGCVEETRQFQWEVSESLFLFR